MLNEEHTFVLCCPFFFRFFIPELRCSSEHGGLRRPEIVDCLSPLQEYRNLQKLQEYVRLLKMDCRVLCVCVEYCEWLRPQGGTAGSGSLAHNEGDVPHLLPVSDGSLNQDLREVKKRWRRGAGKKKSQLLSRLPCGRLAVLAVRRFF